MKNKIVNNIYIFLGIIIVTFLCRWPFFFPSSIDWDESTFLLIGQSILDGHLPYTELWDVKPPLLFFVFAAMISICGKNIICIRIIGSLFVAASAFFVYQSGKYIGTITTGLIAATLFIVMTGESGGKPVMSEILAALPLTSAFFLMICQKENTRIRSYFLLGSLLSMATLIRLNLAYLDLVIFLYYAILAVFKRKLSSLINLIAFTSGLLIPMIIMVIPYIVTDNLLIFYKSVVVASLNYSTLQTSRSAITSHLITQGLLRVNFILWIGFFGGLALIIHKISFPFYSSKNYNRRPLILLLVWLVATAFSIASSGNTFAHYIIQILPFMTITSAFFFSSELLYKFRYILLTLFSIGLLDFSRPIFAEYGAIITKLKTGIPLQNDEGYQLADFLRKENPHKEPVYIMDFHIAHWLTDTKPITKIVTHPSSISKDYLLQVIEGEETTTESEIARILNKKPLFIVKKLQTDYLDSNPEASNLLSTALKQKYKLVTKIESLYVYRRRD